jgi:hypothetical protein
MLSRRVRGAGLLDPLLRYYTWKIAATALALVAGWTAFAVLAMRYLHPRRLVRQPGHRA